MVLKILWAIGLPSNWLFILKVKSAAQVEIISTQSSLLHLLSLHPTKILIARIHVFWSVYVVFNFFISSIKYEGSFICAKYLSPESQKSHSWKLKIRHHHCAGIKLICLKYHFQSLETFHKKLSDWQQLKDELENNVRKWHWVGHVQKTITYVLPWTSGNVSRS